MRPLYPFSTQCRESIKALSLLLRGHAGKFNNPSTDKAECAHLRECVIELISAYPPMAIKVRHPLSPYSLTQLQFHHIV